MLINNNFFKNLQLFMLIKVKFKKINAKSKYLTKKHTD